MTTTDLIIIGAGPGGYRAAEYAAKQGLKVTIFEGSDVGGTCLNVGFIPTKTYVHSETFEEARERMAQVVPQLRAGVEGILSHPNITLIRENASFATTPLLQEGLGEVPIIIATGSETKWLPIKGKDDPRVVDSTGLLQLDTQPKRLAIIGAGVIACLVHANLHVGNRGPYSINHKLSLIRLPILLHFQTGNHDGCKVEEPLALQ